MPVNHSAIDAALKNIVDSPAKKELEGLIADLLERNERCEKLLRLDSQQTREALDRSLAQYQAIFNQMTEGLVIFDPQGNLLDMNPAALAIHGFDSVDSIRRHLDTLTDVFELFDLEGHPLPTDQWPIGRALRGETFNAAEVRVRRRDTGKTWIGSYGGTPVKDSNGQPLMSIVTLRDVTAQKQAEAALKKSEEKFSKAFHSSPTFLFISELDTGTFVEANDAYCELTGYARKEIIGRTSGNLGIISTQEREKLLQPLHRTGRIHNTEIRITRKTGETRLCLFSAEKIAYRNRQCLICSGFDVTERKKAEYALSESEERFRTMADGLPLIVWVHDAEGKQQFVNKTFAEFFGVSMEEVGGDRWKILVHPDDAEAYTAEFLSCVEHRRPFNAQVRVQRADGRWRWIESWGRPRFSSTGKFLGFVGTSVDITRRKRVEEALRDYRENLENEVQRRTAEIEKQNRQLEEMNLLIKQITQYTLQAMENDRRALSKEIHDSIGGSLAAIKMLLESRLENTDRPSAESITSLERIIAYLADVIKESKRISYQMRSLALDDFGLAAAVSETIRKFKEFYPKIEVDYQVHLLRNEIPDEVKTVIYRVVQEALNNIGKHSGAELVQVALSESDNQISLKIEDNGCGFDVKKIFETREPLHAFGLHSMKERIEICKGTFQVKSTEGEGTVVSASIPKPVSQHVS